uniref:Importinlike protein putative n=1 Tax=Albugo laibachii Nc14 TaxID=890382 RepID=F0X1V6_9STRA|nr:importinlike protein putative [Albugo laibachii Nc14]|eukprot:CCA27813.1 importinlike protein putative [Albugo laibachii Nc14]
MNSSVDGSIVRSVLKLTNISTKLIAVILTNAFRALATQKFELVNAILQKMCHFIARFQAQFSSGQDQKAIEIQAGKCMYQMSKLLMKIQASYPMECRQHLQEFLQLYWEILEANGNADTKIGIVTVRFFTNVLDCELYRTQCGPRTSKVMQKVISANGQVELSDEMIAQAQYTISQFFNMPSQSSDVSRLETLLQRVVLQLMRRSANDLEAWRKDPESFFHLSNNLTAEESIRVAAENLFLTMLQRYPAICIPEFQKLIVQIPEKLQYIINTHPTSSLESFEMSLEMDSILLALGLGSFILYQHIDFEPLYTSAFYPLFARPYAYHIGSLVWEGAVLPLVFNRSIWLIGRWLGQLVPSHWPFLYQSVMTNSFGIEEAASTSNLEDIALKLQTTSLIECMAADWSFQLDHLKPYLPMILHGLYSLLMTTGTLESKQKILCTLETIAKVLGPSIIVYLPQLCTPLATLWARPSDDSNLVRGSILRFLKQILLCVNELLSDDTEYEMDAIQHKLLPLQEMCLQGVQSAVNAKPADPYLLENGLALWYQLILSVKDYSDQLAAIFPHALEIVQLEYEHGLTILGIIEKYLKLDGSERFWDVYHAPILSICITPMIKNVKSQVSIALAHLLERILEHLQIRGMIFSSFSNELVEPTQRLVACCVEYSENHEDKEPESVIISYLHVFALLVLFLDQCDWVYVSVLNSDSKVLTQLVDLMLDKFPSGHAQCINTNSSSVWYPWQLRKKLWASALISLLAWRIPGCVDRVGDIKRIANDILKETQSDDHQQQQIRGTKWEKVTRFDLKSCLDRNGKSLRNQ